MELKNAQTIINISKCKLQKYLDTIKKHVAKNPSEEFGQALDGIEELCSFLDVKFIFPYNSRSQPIDQALEADESRQFKSSSPEIKRLNEGVANGTAQSSQIEQLEEGEEEEEDDIQISIIVNGATAYEKPDTGYMVNSSRFLGNRKEVELIPIITDERIAVGQRTTLSGVPSIDPLGYRDD